MTIKTNDQLSDLCVQDLKFCTAQELLEQMQVLIVKLHKVDLKCNVFRFIEDLKTLTNPKIHEVLEVSYFQLLYAITEDKRNKSNTSPLSLDLFECKVKALLLIELGERLAYDVPNNLINQCVNSLKKYKYECSFNVLFDVIYTMVDLLSEKKQS